MKRLTCEMCGGTDLIKQDGVFVCQSCGCKYSLEEARKLMIEGTVEVAGTVKVDNTGLIASYLQMAENALDASNNAEAENYANKIIEIDPRAYRAWYIKGNAAGWQTTGRNNRFPESIVNWTNAWQFAPEDKKEGLAAEITAEAQKIGAAIVQMELNSYVRFRSKENLNDVTNAAAMLEKQLGDLKDKTGIDAWTEGYKTIVARAMNGGAVEASNASDKDFGPENRNRDRYQWNRYTEAQDGCLTILDKAYALTYDDPLCLTICKNYIYIGTQVRDSCSYKFQASTYGEGTYVVDYLFTEKAKEIRSNTLQNWIKRRDLHDPDKRKAGCEAAKEAIAASRGEAEKQMAIAQYWRVHADEKTALEREKAEHEARLAVLRGTLAENADKAAMDRIDAQIGKLERQMASLGLFKGREKRELQAQIDALRADRKKSEESWEQAKTRNEGEQELLRARIAEIDAEFTRDRGSVKVAPLAHLTLFDAEGKLVPTGLQVADYHRAVLPQGLTVKGEGGEAVFNYTRNLTIMAKGMAALVSALGGDRSATDNLDLSYTDDPEKFKMFRIAFLAGGEAFSASANFLAKTPDTVISGEYYYYLEDDKTPEKVAKFARLVSAAVPGICRDIDTYALQNAVAEAAFGITPETVLDAGDMTVTVTGGGKKNTMVKVTPKR